MILLELQEKMKCNQRVVCLVRKVSQVIDQPILFKFDDVLQSLDKHLRFNRISFPLVKNKLFIASYYSQLSADIKIKIIRLILIYGFYFDICGKLSVIRCYT